MQQFLGDLESGLHNLETHYLPLAIAKKILDENCFRTTQKTTDREPPSFKIGNRVCFKNKKPGKWDLKWRPGYRIVHIECNWHYLHIENQATGKTRSCIPQRCSTQTTNRIMECQHTNWQNRKIHQPPCKFANFHTCHLKMKTLLMYMVTCK